MIPQKAEIVETEEDFTYWFYNHFEVDGIYYSRTDIGDIPRLHENIPRPIFSALQDFPPYLMDGEFDGDGYLKMWIPTSGFWSVKSSRVYCENCWLKAGTSYHVASFCSAVVPDPGGVRI